MSKQRSNQITRELLLRRSEHHESRDLFTLQELALHQFDIQKIELVDKFCPNLKILLLQNNQIRKIENLSRLKYLLYLNLALNNITSLTGLSTLSSLQKLDITLNFISDPTEISRLSKNTSLTELHAVGNECSVVEGWRDYVAATLSNLQWLDGTEIKISDRLKARKRIFQLRKIVDTFKKLHPTQSDDFGCSSVPEEANDIRDSLKQTSGHSIAAREALAESLSSLRKPAPVIGGQQDPLPEPKLIVEPESGTKDALQCNTGSWPYMWTTLPSFLHFRVDPPAQISAEELQTRVYGQWKGVRVEARNMVCQIKVPVEMEKVDMDIHGALTFRNSANGAVEVVIPTPGIWENDVQKMNAFRNEWKEREERLKGKTTVRVEGIPGWNSALGFKEHRLMAEKQVSQVTEAIKCTKLHEEDLLRAPGFSPSTINSLESNDDYSGIPQLEDHFVPRSALSIHRLHS